MLDRKAKYKVRMRRQAARHARKKKTLQGAYTKKKTSCQ